MDIARVVDIYFADDDSFGSGYALTDRLILTAAHVAAAALPGAECEIRPLTDIGAHLTATLLRRWDDHDAALLELNEGYALPRFQDEIVRFGRAGEGDDNIYSCRAIGFPYATSFDGVRQEWELRGRLIRGIRARRYAVEPENAVPAGADQWPGFSGAAVFCKTLLVGIVQAVATSFDGRMLQALPIDVLLSDQDFVVLLAAGMGRKPVLKTTQARGQLGKVGKLSQRIGPTRGCRGAAPGRWMARRLSRRQAP